VCTMARSEECRRFGLVPTSIYEPTRKRARALWRTIAGGGACCVVCLSSNCEQVWLRSGDRGAIFGGACVGVRERKHLRSKKYTKNRWALLRMPARLPHNRRSKQE